MIQLNIIKYSSILLTLIILNIFNIYSGGCCKKCKECCAKLCKGENKDPSDDEILELKDFLFGVLFYRDEDSNFVFYDYITITKLEDENILKKIGKKKSDDVYVLNVDITNSIFSDENIDNKSALKFSKKQYEEDKNKKQYNYLRDGRIDSKKYGTVIYYIEFGKLCIYCKDVKYKLYKKGENKTFFHYEGNNVDIKDCEITKYIEDKRIVEKTKQITPIIEVESSSLSNKVVVTFYKKKGK